MPSNQLNCYGTQPFNPSQAWASSRIRLLMLQAPCCQPKAFIWRVLKVRCNVVWSAQKWRSWQMSCAQTPWGLGLKIRLYCVSRSLSRLLWRFWEFRSSKGTKSTFNTLIRTKNNQQLMTVIQKLKMKLKNYCKRNLRKLPILKSHEPTNFVN